MIGPIPIYVTSLLRVNPHILLSRDNGKTNDLSNSDLCNLLLIWPTRKNETTRDLLEGRKRHIRKIFFPNQSRFDSHYKCSFSREGTIMAKLSVD